MTPCALKNGLSYGRNATDLFTQTRGVTNKIKQVKTVFDVPCGCVGAQRQSE